MMMQFYVIGIAITFFLAFILVSKKHKSEADNTLFAWLVLIGVHLTFFYLTVTERLINFPFLLGLEAPMPLLQVPALYLYTAAATNYHLSWKEKLGHYFIPIAAYLYFCTFYFQPATYKVEIYHRNGAGYEMSLAVVRILVSVLSVLYVILSLRLLSKYKKAIENQFSYTEKINLDWLRYLIIGMSIIWFIVFFEDDFLIYTAVVLFVVFIGYFGIKQVGIFTNFHLEEEEKPILLLQNDTVEETRKYERSGLNDETAKELHQRLTTLMQEKKYYKNPELTLTDLAQALETNPNYLSQVINTFEEMNFFDYINLKRVEAFKQIVSSPDAKQFTLLSLAFDCGFNSKTSFNRNFKKVTGLSPSEYLKEI